MPPVLAPTRRAAVFTQFAALLEYPGEDFRRRVAACRSHLRRGGWAGAGRALDRFLAQTDSATLGALQERYTAAFDLQPLAPPYASIHLFGEDNYKRGALMARFNEAFARRGITTGGELPDHLAVLLRALPRLALDEQTELVQCCLVQTVERMTDALRKNRHPYAHLLRAIRSVLAAEFGAAPSV